MKTTHLLLTTAIALLLFGASQLSVSGADKPSPAPQGSHESAELKVLKVFLAKDGDAIYRAYLVRWKNQEVVVCDTLARSDYHVGDKAKVLVMRNSFPNGEEKYGLLHFAILGR